VFPGKEIVPARAQRRLAFLCGVAVAGSATAGTFSIAPIRVELNGSQRTAVVTVHNDEDTPMVVQATTLAWSQPGGEEHTEATRDILVTPPVFTLPPKGEQVVRVALRSAPDATRELDYRLLLAEVPGPPEQGFTGLRLALRLSMPVFVAPAKGASAQVSWSARRLADGKLVLVARNDGTAHLQVLDFNLQFGDASHAVHVGQMRYVLPGSAVQWQVTPPDGASPDAPLALRGLSDLGSFEASPSLIP
jgi:fimbrial chaperone protein